MIRLYEGSGSSEIMLGQPCMDDDRWANIKAAAVRLMRKRNQNGIADFLEKTPFEVRAGMNSFNDDFSLLYYAAPIDDYVDLSAQVSTQGHVKVWCRIIVQTLSEFGCYLRFIAVECAIDPAPSVVPTPNLAITSDLVERALDETERAVAQHGGVAGVDRAHTAFHGYLKEICAKAQIPHNDDADITQLFKLLTKQHPALTEAGPRGDDITKILRGMAAILDALNPVRNRATLAHPNAVLLPDAEAMLAINTIRTLLHYLNAKISG